MPFSIGGTGTGGGGGGDGFHLGKEQNRFEGADLDAARAARDTYQHDLSNREWLESYEADGLAFIILQPATGAITTEVIDSIARTSASVFGKGSIPARPTSGAPSGRGANRRWQFDIGTGAQSTAFKTAFDGRGSGAEWYLRVNGQGADRRVTSILRYSSGAVRIFYEGEGLTLASTTWDIIQVVTTPTWQEVSGLGVKDTPGPKGDSIQIQFSVDGSTNWASTPPAGTKYLRTREGTGNWTTAIKFVGEGTPGATLQVQYSSDNTDWHDTLASNDLYIRQRVGSSASWSIGIPFVGASAEIQYSADGSNWHDTLASGDSYIRFQSNRGSWSIGRRFIGATSDARSIYTQYSADNSNWHETLASTDLYIRLRIGTSGTWSDGRRFVGADAPHVQAQYSTDGNTWSATYSSGNLFVRWSYDGGTTYGNAIRFQGRDGEDGKNAPQGQIQYSDNGTTWAATTTTNTRYIRFSMDGGTTWGGAIDLRGAAPAPRSESIYYGVVASTASTEATITPLVSTLTNEQAVAGGHDITIGPTTSSGQRFVIIVPADHDLATLNNKFLGTNALDEFTRIAWTAQLNSVSVVSYHSGRLRNNVSIEYTLTLN